MPDQDVDLHEIDRYYLSKDQTKIQTLTSIEGLRSLTQKKAMLEKVTKSLIKFANGFKWSLEDMRMVKFYYSILLTDAKTMPTIVQKSI